MGCTMTTPREKHNSLSSKKSYCSTIDTIDYLKSVSNIAPVNYRFKVESYSQLCEALERNGIDHFESTPFNAGGYQWMLSVYPNGKKRENGDGHISTYIKLVDKITGDKVILATMKIFIYDHLHEQYLTVQDTRVRTFDAFKAEWGIPKLVDITAFKDPANGFLFNNGCFFGVEILVQCENKIRTSLYPVQGLLDTDNLYAWKVDNFLNLEEDSISSPIFSLGGYKWKLIMYPRGFEESKGKSLSLFFGPADTFDGKLFVELSMNALFTASRTTTWFSNPDTVVGFPDFAPLSEVTGRRYMSSDRMSFTIPSKNDPITIQVQIHVLFLLKDL